jgi:hypothetical protein
MDGDLLSPKRKRTGRPSSLKKSNATRQQYSQLYENSGSSSHGDCSRECESPNLSGYSLQDGSPMQGGSPLKAPRYSGLSSGNSMLQHLRNGKEKTALGINALGINGQDFPEFSTTPRSDSQVNTTVESRSMIRKNDDTSNTLINSSLSPDRSHYSNNGSFLRDAAIERKTNNRDKQDLEKERRGSKSGTEEVRINGSPSREGKRTSITKSDYSPKMPSRKGREGDTGTTFPSSSTIGAMGGTTFKKPSFSCPGSENLRPPQETEDEWRSSFEGDGEGEDGESDEEEKSSSFNASSPRKNKKLNFSPRPSCGQDNYITDNRRLRDEKDHQQMDSNMSSMALHVGKDKMKGKMKSRTIFDTESSLIQRRNRRVNEELEVSSCSTSFVDALAASNYSRNKEGDQTGVDVSRRPSLTNISGNLFLNDESNEEVNSGMSTFEQMLIEREIFDHKKDIEWRSSPSPPRSNMRGDSRVDSRGDRQRFQLFNSSSPDRNLHTPVRLGKDDFKVSSKFRI